MTVYGMRPTTPARDLRIKHAGMRGHRWRVILMVALAGFAIRACYLIGSPRVPIVGDAAGYLFAADQVLLGETSVRSAFVFKTWGPGYSTFLAGVLGITGGSHEAVLWLQALLGSTSVGLVAWLAHRLGGPRSALPAGLFMALSPGLIASTGRFLSETLAIFLLLIGLALAYEAVRRDRVRWAIAAGLWLALALFCRPPLYVIPPFVAVGVALGLRRCRWNRRVAMGACLVLAATVPVAAWSRAAQHSFAGQPGIAGSGGVWFLVDRAVIAWDPLFKGWLPDGDQILAGRWPGDWGHDPVHLVQAATDLSVVHLSFSTNEFGESMLLGPGGLDWVHRGLILAGVLGLGLALARWRRWSVMLGCLLGAGVMAGMLVEPRRVLPYLPILCLSAGSLVGLGTGGLRFQRRRLAGRALALAGGAATTFFVTRLWISMTVFRGVQPSVLGRVADAGTLAAVGLLVAATAVLLRARSNSLRRLSGVFAVGTLCLVALLVHFRYDSDPRWKQWWLEVPASGAIVEQSIHIPENTRGAEVRQLSVLVEMRGDDIASRCSVGAFSGTRSEVARPLRAAFLEWSQTHDRTVNFWRPYYLQIGESHRLDTCPQWWIAELPTWLAQSEDVVVRLAITGGVESELRRSIAIGGHWPTGSSGVLSLASPSATRPGPSTSIYRWQVLRDWRRWESISLVSPRAPGRAVEPSANRWPARSIGPRDEDQERLEFRGCLNIWLRVEMADGTVKFL